MTRPRTSRNPRPAGPSQPRPALRLSGDGSWWASTCQRSRNSKDRKARRQRNPGSGLFCCPYASWPKGCRRAIFTWHRGQQGRR